MGKKLISVEKNLKSVRHLNQSMGKKLTSVEKFKICQKSQSIYGKKVNKC